MRSFQQFCESEYPMAIPVVQTKLNTNVGIRELVDQYLRAFERRIEAGIDDNMAKNIIDTTVRQLAPRGEYIAEFFKTKAEQMLRKHRDLAAAMKRQENPTTQRT